MSTPWRNSDSAPLVTLVATYAGATGVVGVVIAIAMMRSGRPDAPALSPALPALATLATELTSPPPVEVGAREDHDELGRDIQTPAGFDVELVYTVPREQGSWVSLTHDGRGRLIASDQASGLFRIRPCPIGTDPAGTHVEAIDTPVGAAQGLLCIDDDLYCVVAGSRAEGEGLYRLRDTNGDDTYDEWRLLRALNHGGEHGPHAVVLGPDGMLYVVAGNHTRLPEPERSVVPRNWGEDQLLPRLWDAGGHAVGILAPGGWICRTDRDGASWELFATGFRNAYDIAFNRDGELFAYDSDMEWDMGAPWYRPTRINHVVSGAEFGWRSGTGKWPTYAADSLPSAVDIGPGSPTGVCFGYDTNFPPPYQNALYALDWTFGTIYAVSLTADGASYQGVAEPFVTGRPLPVADVVANPADGALYFVVGGRGVPSAVYRVVHAGDVASTPTETAATVPPARRLRQTLERLHASDLSTSVIDEIWPHLGSRDRHVAFAARIALEHQPVANWISRVRDEPDPRTRLIALVALARCADGSAQSDMIAGLESMSWRGLSHEERLSWLRAWKLCFIRLGPPDDATTRRLATRLEALYPAGDDLLERELCDLLVALGSPVVVARTLALMEQADRQPVRPIDPELVARNDTYGSAILKMASAQPGQQAVHHGLALRTAHRGWTPALRERYFEWFRTAKLTHGGMSFAGFLDQIAQDALDQLPAGEQERYRALLTPPASPPDMPDMPMPRGPGRAWTVGELAKVASTRLQRRDFANGQRMYTAAMCIRCHRFAGTGVMGGPDLTAVATRYTPRDLIESIVEPSRTISDQYEQTEFVLDDDTVVLGRIIGRDDHTVRVMPTPLAPEFTIDVDLNRIARENRSTVSGMMPGLANGMNADEVLDLLAYLLAEGDARHPLFAKEDSE